jgi:hypothetical protein
LVFSPCRAVRPKRTYSIGMPCFGTSVASMPAGLRATRPSSPTPASGARPRAGTCPPVPYHHHQRALRKRSYFPPRISTRFS